MTKYRSMVRETDYPDTFNHLRLLIQIKPYHLPFTDT